MRPTASIDIPSRVLIVGLGASGVAVARFLGRMGKEVTVTDQKTASELGPALAQLEGFRYRASLGGHLREDFLTHDLIVLSPGVDTEMPLIREARGRGVRVTGETELAFLFVDEPVIAVTGTNGKTTTTSLLGAIFERAFGKVFVGGNIGNPLMNYVIAGESLPFLILELSSFQLETIETFRPRTSLLLNVTEDHLDRYRSFDDYRSAKYRIFENQKGDDFAVINEEIILPRDIAARIYRFSAKKVLPEGAFCRDGRLCVRLGGKEHEYPRGLSPLRGIHNTENILSAIMTAHIHGVAGEVVTESLRRFRGLAHRVEPVRTVKGVTFLNDSKATNVDATKRALEGMEEKVVLIAGGKDKGGSYAAIIPFADRIKAIVLIGEAKGRILQELEGHFTTFSEESLERAVEKAYSIAGPGESVLFSPMCSSFDMFIDYKDRGNRFRNIVEAL